MKQKLIGMALSCLLGTAGLRAQDSIQHVLADSANNSPVWDRESGVTIWNDPDSTVSIYIPRWEVTSNVTLALSRFSGNVSRNLNDDPYLLMVRKISYNEKDRVSAWRLGVNGFRRKTEDFSGGFSGQVTRTSEENWASLVVGREWRRDLGFGFYAYGGFDARGIWRNSTSTSLQFDGFGTNTLIVTEAKEYGGSVGGFGGIAVKLHDRINLYTESILYGQLLNTERSFSVNGVRTSLEAKQTFTVIPMVPIALFLSIQF
jgi:hypothetical protein